ncbi:MAG: glycosyltransferase family 39 protein [Cyanobacteria bacterium SIG29]|nr:glycosyltransferase family 39 protein [Cyanobacteria bacterium SIG29]
MSNFLKKDIGIILLLTVLFFAILPFFYMHQGLFSIDTGREFYIPQQMLKGEILYKDIFNIYGAFSYQLNAILFKIFGVEFKTLYWAGILNSLGIIITLYLLAREFLAKNISALFSITIMFSLVFTTFLYNSNVPYTYAIAYALSSFLLSILFLIKYIKSENSKMAYLACLFAGISLSNKYEFTLYPLILIYVFCFLKPLGIKKGFKAILSFLLIPIISFGSLFLNFNEIKETINLTQNLINAPILKIFFEKFGVFFNLKGIISLIISNPIYALFGFIPIINLSLFIIFFKKIYENKTLFVFILCAICASAKTFFFLNISHMGAFILPICLLATITFIKPKQISTIFLIFCSLIFASENFNSLEYKKFELNNVYTYQKDGEQLKISVDYILENSLETDKVVVLPEGSYINFLTNRKGNNFYYNLSPLFYYDVFGEERVLKHFQNNLPEYFIILPINNIEYGKRFFGADYAQDFYEMIINNYNLVKEENNVKIFRKKI